MRFLVDQPVSPLLAEWLREQNHEAVHVRERGLSAASDDVIFALALAESRVLITSDLDFSRIIALSRRDGPGLILFRAGNITDQAMLVLLQRVLAEVEHGQLPKSVVVIDEWAIRVAALPIVPGR